MINQRRQQFCERIRRLKGEFKHHWQILDCRFNIIDPGFISSQLLATIKPHLTVLFRRVRCGCALAASVWAWWTSEGSHKMHNALHPEGPVRPGFWKVVGQGSQHTWTHDGNWERNSFVDVSQKRNVVTQVVPGITNFQQVWRECILHLIFTNILRYTNGYGKLRTSSRTTINNIEHIANNGMNTTMHTDTHIA